MRETALRGFVWCEEPERLDPGGRWRQPKSIGLAHRRYQRGTAPLANSWRTCRPPTPDKMTLAMPRVSPHDCSDSCMGRLIRCVARMHIETCGVDGTQDCLGPSHFRDGAMCHDQKVIRRQISLVLKYAVLRNANAIERRAKCTQPADQDSVLDP